jgi:hypothetical protein
MQIPQGVGADRQFGAAPDADIAGASAPGEVNALAWKSQPPNGCQPRRCNAALRFTVGNWQVRSK